ncbi:MAG: hypothetical protein HYR55_02865 [Acidobacteria bacterium]|nr:hypothetical protein [Acidobacteriota bacterium]MBI3655949.1 hypothetical protein [Acidobacteriota bacterium]
MDAVTNGRQPVRDLRRELKMRTRTGALLLLVFLVRFSLMLLPGYPPDLQDYKIWAIAAGQRGIHTVYDPSPTPKAESLAVTEVYARFDYPPLYAYLLAPMGRFYVWITPNWSERFAFSHFFSLIVKLPPLLFDLLLALLLARLSSRPGFWNSRGANFAWFPALLYLIHPAVLFDSAYWGQPDSVEIFLSLLALALILWKRSSLGWSCAALACLMKPLAVPFLPLLAVATWHRSGWSGLARGAVAVLLTSLVVYLPFIATERGGLAFARLIRDVNVMPYTSLNAHNLWWLIAPWRSTEQPIFAGISPTAISLLLFASAYLFILVCLLRRVGLAPSSAQNDGAGEEFWLLAWTGVAFSFFYLSTHMHENHLFAVIPASILLAERGRPWRYFAIGIGIAVLMNMVIHDWHLSRLWIWKIGGFSDLLRPDIKSFMPVFELALATANSLFVTALYFFFAIVVLWKSRYLVALRRRWLN